MLWFCGGTRRLPHAGRQLRRAEKARHRLAASPADGRSRGRFGSRPSSGWPMTPSGAARPGLAAPPPVRCFARAGKRGRWPSARPTRSPRAWLIAATPSPNAVNVAIPPPAGNIIVVGEPQLMLHVSGHGERPAGLFLRADRRRAAPPCSCSATRSRRSPSRSTAGRIRSRARSRASPPRLRPARGYTLQITGGSSVYGADPLGRTRAADGRCG